MDWKSVGYQMEQGRDNRLFDLWIVRVFAKLIFSILIFGVAFVVFQTVVSWAVGLIGPLVGFALIGYIAIKVLLFFARRN